MPAPLTTTSYALLGLLHLRPWTTYELAKQVQRSLNWFWPRAERRLYDEPKLLASQGLVDVEDRWTGKRRSREYAITEVGTSALEAWLDEEPAPRSTEFEGMLKVFFGDAGTLEQMRVNVDRVAAEAQERIDTLGAMALEPHAFPERRHLSALTLTLQVQQERAIVEWADWARAALDQWASTRDPGEWDVASALAALHGR